MIVYSWWEICVNRQYLFTVERTSESRTRSRKIQ